MSAHAARPVGRRLDEGISLVELLVSMMLLGLILAMASGLYASVARSVAISRSMDSSTRVASNAANELGQVIRYGTTLKVAGATAAAPAFTFAGRESVVLYSNTDVDAYASLAVRPIKPTMVRFSIDPTTRALVESRWTAIASGSSWTFPASTTTPTTSVNLGNSFLDPGAGVPLFTYLDKNGAVVPMTAGNVLPGDLKSIVSVRLTIRVQGAGGSSGGPVIIENTIAVLS